MTWKVSVIGNDRRRKTNEKVNAELSKQSRRDEGGAKKRAFQIFHPNTVRAFIARLVPHVKTIKCHWKLSYSLSQAMKNESSNCLAIKRSTLT